MDLILLGTASPTHWARTLIPCAALLFVTSRISCLCIWLRQNLFLQVYLNECKFYSNWWSYLKRVSKTEVVLVVDFIPSHGPYRSVGVVIIRLVSTTDSFILCTSHTWHLLLRRLYCSSVCVHQGSTVQRCCSRSPEKSVSCVMLNIISTLYTRYIHCYKLCCSVIITAY